MEEDPIEQLQDEWLSTLGNSNTFSLAASHHDNRRAGNFTCPGCSAPVQPGYALNHASCSCGCNFCARCGALYLSSLEPEQQPAAEAARQQLLQLGGSSSSSSMSVASCSCGAVDKVAVAARWGASAVACWPAEPRLQELLLLLLQQHQEQVVPLLSRQLLQRLEAHTQLHWERVQQAAGVIQKPSAKQQRQQAAAGSAGNAEQQPSLEFMPADATPSFVGNGHVAGQKPDTMQLDVDPYIGGAAAAAAALRITAAPAAAAAAAHASSGHNGPVVMQLDGPAAQPQHGWQQQEQRLLGIGMPVAAAGQLQEALEQHLLLDLAADVAAAGQQQEAAAAAEAASVVRQPSNASSPAVLQAAPASNAGQGGDSSAQLQRNAPATGWLAVSQRPAAAAAGADHAREAGAAAVPELDGQLGLEDLLGGQPQQEQEPMQQDHAEVEEQHLAAGQPQQRPSGSRAAGAVLAHKGGKLQLAAAAAGWDEEDGSSSSRPATAARAAAVPQLSVFGLLPEAPPVLPDDPVLLLPGQTLQDEPGHTRMFW